MSEDKKVEVDSDTLLKALDQIGQTVDIMGKIVGRLRNHINEQREIEAKERKSTLLQFDDSELPTPYRNQSGIIH